jgi:hypothetical protein
MLKGNTLCDILPHAVPLAIFIAVMALVALKAYRSKLD